MLDGMKRRVLKILSRTDIRLYYRSYRNFRRFFRKERGGKEFSSNEEGRVPRIGYLKYRCNICGKSSEGKVTEFGREEPSCLKCGSTVRMRSIIYLLSNELLGKNLALPDFPKRSDIVGIGMSDWEGYAVPLARKLSYKNTYYHGRPYLDITRIDPRLENTLDFLISSDVFEHVAPPVSVAFENAYKLLKPRGLFIFTAPYSKNEQTKEHFPELYDYRIIKNGGRSILKNLTKDGREQVFEDLVFHGGAGLTLEMRVFSEASLMKELGRAGFSEVTIHKEEDLEHGIFWPYDWSLPITARK
jgi:SAM-dependent methyltransferase